MTKDSISPERDCDLNTRVRLDRAGQQLLSTGAYREIRDFIYREAGIELGERKQQLVSSRLGNRLKFHQLSSFDDYARMISAPGNSRERQMAIDLLTTNETYFFREATHFDTLRSELLQQHRNDRTFRAWSAACSSGEEAYSIAMVLDDFFGSRVNWEVLGSDISERMVDKAKSGFYQAHRIDAIPQSYLKRYCMKGSGEHEGLLLINEMLRERITFAQINLTRNLPDTGLFDVIFLRNVLIYFDNPTKEKIIRNIETRLRPGGILYIGHSESLKGMDLALTLVAPTTYQKKVA